MNYEAVIGLEIHAELKTQTKMFCDSLNDPNETHPNVNICPVCMGHPGTLPVMNREAVKKVIRVGLALHGEIAAFSQFARKNYFYPDLPKGYQISQYEHPLVNGGYLELPATPLSGDPEISNLKSQTRRIRIQRVHLEEDTGRLIHDPKTHTTLVDFNRAGIPLMELVTEPDCRNAGEAVRFAEELRRILQYLSASDADMEKGQMRIEANVSIRPAGSETLGAKVELKNINSFRFVGQAIGAEIERQRELLLGGERVIQETRGWDETTGTTVPQRLKEEAQDYRYFPEPDLPPLRIDPAFVAELQSALPELPQQKLKRFREEYRIDANIAAILVADKHLAHFFEAVASELREWLSATGKAADDTRAHTLAANYLTTDLARLLAETGASIRETVVTPENFAELITYIAEGRISSRAAKEVLKEMVSSGADPSAVIEERKLWQISESADLALAVEGVIAANPKAATDYKSGKSGALQFLVGQVMKEAHGANPEAVRKLLEKKLK